MDGSIIPVLALITLGLVCVFGYISAVRSYNKARDPNAEHSSLARRVSKPDLLPPDVPGSSVPRQDVLHSDVRPLRN